MKFTEILKVGHYNDPEAVKAVKVKLNELGYKTSKGETLDESNGNYGETTKALVERFQLDRQLLDDGIVGKLTWERLFNPLVKTTPNSKILRMRALEIAKTQLHVRELTGKNDGVEVISYLNAVGLGKGYAWCQAFVFWCFEKAAQELQVKNPVPKTAGVLECLRQAKKAGITIIVDPKQFQAGDQGIMDFGGGKGHTFLIEQDKDEDEQFTIEGNTNNGGSRDGDGVYERTRFDRFIVCVIRYE